MTDNNARDMGKEREYLLAALRCASARAKLADNVFTTIGVSLRHQKISTDQAMEWIRNEGLLDHIQLGPAGAK